MRVDDGIDPVTADSQDFAQCGDNRPVIMEKFDFYPLPLINRRSGFYGTAADGDIHDFSGIPPLIDDHFFGFFIFIDEKEAGINNDLQAAEAAGGQLFNLAGVGQLQSRAVRRVGGAQNAGLDGKGLGGLGIQGEGRLAPAGGVDPAACSSLGVFYDERVSP